jgi:hypothetical protein
MIQKKMNKDITQMEGRVFFGLTPRQIVCSIIAFAVALLVNKIFGFIEFRDRGFIIMVLASPFLACGWIKIQGLPFEKHLWILIKYNLSKKERVWENEE